MDRMENAAKSVRKLTTLCLAKAISTAMRAAYGDDWFRAVKTEDSGYQSKEKRILGNADRFADCDFQALLKLLYYRKSCRDAVFGYYQPQKLGPDSKREGQNFDALLLRLIDYRNNLDAHERVEDVERQVRGETLKKIYGYNEAIVDMVKLTEVFEIVADEQGVSYYTRVRRIQSDLMMDAVSRAYPISEMIKKEKLRADVDEIVKICQDLQIEVRIEQYVLCFVTYDYERTV